MLSKTIQYQIKKSFISTFQVMGVIICLLGVLSCILYILGGKLTHVPEYELISWVYFVVFAIGCTDSAKYFCTMNQLGVTRRQQACGYLLHGVIFAVGLAFILMLLNWLVPDIYLNILDLKIAGNTPNFNQLGVGGFLMFVWESISGLFDALMIGACLGLFINKFNQKIGIWIGVGCVIFGPILLGLSFGILADNLSDPSNQLGQWLNYFVRIAIEVPAQAYQAFTVVVLIGLYWLLQRRHVAKVA